MTLTRLGRWSLVSAALSVILAIARAGLGLATTSSYSWALPVRELTLSEWQTPGSLDFRPALPLDDTARVQGVRIGTSSVATGNGFEWLEPLIVRDSRSCALRIRGSGGDTPEVDFTLIDKAQSSPSRCDSELMLRPNHPERTRVPAAQKVVVSAKLSAGEFAFLMKPFKAQTLSWVGSSPVTILAGSKSCQVTPESPLTLSGDDLYLSRAALRREGLFVTVEAKGKFDIQAGLSCELKLGAADAASWLEALITIVAALTAALAIALKVFEISGKQDESGSASSGKAGKAHGSDATSN